MGLCHSTLIYCQYQSYLCSSLIELKSFSIEIEYEKHKTNADMNREMPFIVEIS